MSYLSKPGAPIVHIADHSTLTATILLADGEHRALNTLCTVQFVDPNLHSYWNGPPKPRQRVCRHCQRTALRIATRLLLDAQGAP